MLTGYLQFADVLQGDSLGTLRTVATNPDLRRSHLPREAHHDVMRPDEWEGAVTLLQSTVRRLRDPPTGFLITVLRGHVS